LPEMFRFKLWLVHLGGIMLIPQRAETLAAIRGVGGRNEKKFDFNSYISLFS